MSEECRSRKGDVALDRFTCRAMIVVRRVAQNFEGYVLTPLKMLYVEDTLGDEIDTPDAHLKTTWTVRS